MSFNLAELENLFEKMGKMINSFENMNKSNKDFMMYLSSGDIIKINFRKSSIAHLLGVNTDYLKLLKLTRYEDSYDILKEMLENPYTIYTKVSNKIIDYNKLFSNYVAEKTDSFLINTEINIKDIEFICIYNSELTYNQQENFEKCDIIMVKKYENDKYGIITFIQNNNTYYPMSSRIYEDFQDAKEDLNKFLRNQKICMVNGAQIHDNYGYHKPFNLLPKDKLRKINSINTYKKEFNCIPDVTEDFKFTLKRSTENYQIHGDENIIISDIANSIRDGKIIEDYEDSRFSEIINAYNDSLFESKNTDNGSTYTKLKQELNELKQELLKYKDSNSELILLKGVLEQENDELRISNEDKAKKLQKIYEIVKPSN